MLKESWSYKAENTVRDIAISADGKFIAAGSYDNYIYFLDKKGNLLWKYRTGNTVRDVGISSNGNYIIAGSYDNKAYFFNKNGNLLWEFKTGNAIRDVAITSKGDYVAVGSDDKNAYFFDKDGDLLWDLETGNTAGRVDLSSDGNYAVVGSLDRNVYYLNKKGKILWQFEANNWIETVRISKDGDFIAAGSDDKNIYYFDKNGKLLWNFKTTGAVERSAVSAHGSYVACGTEGKVYLFDKYGRLLWKHLTGIYEVKGVAMSSGASIIAVGTRDNEIICLDRNGKVIWDYKTGNWVECISSSQRGSYIVAGTRDGKIILFNNITFFENMIENVEDKVYSAKAQGLETTQVERLLLDARASLAERNYFELQEFVNKAKLEIQDGLKRITPKISLQIIANKGFLTRTWTPLTSIIKNSGVTDIYSCKIELLGNFIVTGELKSPIIKRGEVKKLSFSLKPFESGKFPINLKFSYRDVDGKMHYIKERGVIDVRDEGAEIKPKKLFKVG